ncbi:hypothetical protein SGFS_055570 [Streptomyces graminofaciens]|jgi:hypothetical protein|uniref:Uncharacterized protein n=2 Tax=Streptomyces graminofaciens TaxID=68212 RepID=A0ABN5VMA6_9ACTN|nr:hypothetical protein [Streptomyces graminofaciens]BBC34263.1 hypothetical protein SGFS_055570 [Streptomyces graminofaciens]
MGRGRGRSLVVPPTEEAVEQLKAALRDVGVILPSLGVDPVTAASHMPDPLVQLGRCNVRVAAQLIAVLRRAAAVETVEEET